MKVSVNKKKKRARKIKSEIINLKNDKAVLIDKINAELIKLIWF